MKSLNQFILESEGDEFKDSVKASTGQLKEWRKKTDPDEVMVYYEDRDQCYYIYKTNDKDLMKSLEHIGTYNCRTGELYFDKNETKIFSYFIR